MMVYKILQTLYKSILRKMLIKAIDDPETEVDDFIVGVIDKVMLYKEE